jgi:hypothetical protein
VKFWQGVSELNVFSALASIFLPREIARSSEAVACLLVLYLASISCLRVSFFSILLLGVLTIELICAVKSPQIALSKEACRVQI